METPEYCVPQKWPKELYEAYHEMALFGAVSAWEQSDEIQDITTASNTMYSSTNVKFTFTFYIVLHRISINITAHNIYVHLCAICRNK